MKNQLVTTLLFGASLSAVNAQSPITNTAWQGIANVPMPTEIIMHFSKDSTYMHVVPANNVVGETMTYTVKGDTLTLQKTSGNSPCDTQAIGMYLFTLKDDTMTIKPISDDCPERQQAWGSELYRKVAIPIK